MVIVMVSTTADPRRVGLTYKIELPEYAIESWWKANVGLQAQVRAIFEYGKVQGANTSFTFIHATGEVESWAVKISMGDLGAMLQAADQDYSETNGMPGRPEKRVLITSTSKDRRTGASVSKQGGY